PVYATPRVLPIVPGDRLATCRAQWFFRRAAREAIQLRSPAYRRSHDTPRVRCVRLPVSARVRAFLRPPTPTARRCLRFVWLAAPAVRESARHRRSVAPRARVPQSVPPPLDNRNPAA